MINTTTTSQEAAKLSKWMSSWTHLTFEEYFAEQQAGMRHDDCETLSEETIDLGNTWEKVFLGETTIPGKSTLLVDLGSRINVIGCNTEKVMSEAAQTFGHSTKYSKKNQALLIRGVGDGHARCDVEASIPIAVQFAEQATTKEVFQANVATGSGSDLPAILGAASMQEKDGVLCLRKGKEFIAFPGPGGYAIQMVTRYQDFAYEASSIWTLGNRMWTLQLSCPIGTIGDNFVLDGSSTSE